MMFKKFHGKNLCEGFSVCIGIRIRYWIDILSLITTQAQVELSIVYYMVKR